MKTVPVILIVFALQFTTAGQKAFSQEEHSDIPNSPASTAANILANALQHVQPENGSIELLSVAVEEALQLLPKISPAAERLQKSLLELKAGDNSKEAVESIELVQNMLSFKPIKEANLPAGFPSYTPVGVIEIKDYPAYRKAVAKEFWTLFRHIQSNNISMTTPVEMKLSSNNSGNFSQQSMAFLYGNTELGKTGSIGNVDVVDTNPLTVVAIGVRGRRSEAALTRSHDYLLRFIDSHPAIEASGSPRVLGYNSPMVLQSDRFFEVQIPIRRLNYESTQ